jgi:16S rRNA (cytosine967-C5)-methyltransferase
MKGGERLEHTWHHHQGLAKLTPRDRALAVHLASGVLRRLRSLNAKAGELTDGKFSGLTESVQWVLRLGLFQIIDCDRIPPHAAVSTAVEAAKTVSHQGIGGLVNAVLRRAVREKEDPPADTGEPPREVSWGERLSMPDWLVDILFARYGETNAERIDRWANAPPHHYVRLSKKSAGLDRLNTLLAQAKLSPARPHSEFPDYAGVETAALASDSPLYTEPLGWVQNPAAGLVIALLDPQPGDHVMDLFAAPGGKTLAIAEKIGPEGTVLAVDRSAERLRRLTENKERFQAENILPIEADVSGLAERTASRILADVPCSALGTMPKNPEVRWVKTNADIERLARSQRIWLNVAAAHLTVGGILVYSTCTFTRVENEDVINSFLESNDNFVLDSAREFVPERYVTSEGFVSTNPPFDGLDGVFAARLRRTS